MSSYLTFCWKGFCCNYVFNNQVIILHMPFQLNSHGMCKIVTWLHKYFSCENRYHIFSQDLDYELVSCLWNGIGIKSAGYWKQLELWKQCLPAKFQFDIWQVSAAMTQLHGLVQERRNSSALAMELCLSCTNPSSWSVSHTCEIWMLFDG